MFTKHKVHTIPYDRDTQIPVIRSSICTGEQVAGFKEESTGKFHEVMCIRGKTDYEEFLRLYQLKETDVKREW